MELLKHILPKDMIGFIEKYRLPDDEYKALLYKTEISVHEFNLIHAYQIDKCIKKMESEKLPQWVISEVKKVNSWVEEWGRDYFDGIEKAIEHLSKVNNYHTDTNNEPYWHALWLLGWDTEMYERVMVKYGLATKEEKQAIKDKKREKANVSKHWGFQSND